MPGALARAATVQVGRLYRALFCTGSRESARQRTFTTMLCLGELYTVHAEKYVYIRVGERAAAERCDTYNI